MDLLPDGKSRSRLAHEALRLTARELFCNFECSEMNLSNQVVLGILAMLQQRSGRPDALTSTWRGTGWVLGGCWWLVVPRANAADSLLQHLGTVNLGHHVGRNRGTLVPTLVYDFSQMQGEVVSSGKFKTRRTLGQAICDASQQRGPNARGRFCK